MQDQRALPSTAGVQIYTVFICGQRSGWLGRDTHPAALELMANDTGGMKVRPHATALSLPLTHGGMNAEPFARVDGRACRSISPWSLAGWGKASTWGAPPACSSMRWYQFPEYQLVAELGCGRCSQYVRLLCALPGQWYGGHTC